jgi:hypothetical protein
VSLFSRLPGWHGVCGCGGVEGAGAGAGADGSRWVRTANGQNFADSIGVPEPPMTLEQSVSGVLAQVGAS